MEPSRLTSGEWTMIVSELFQDILQPVGEHAITSANGSPKKRRNQDQPVIGLLNNSKPNVDYFLEGVEQKLQSVENPDDVLVFVKPRSAGPCPDIDQIAERCDFVVNAVADCGSCTAWSIHDSIELEQMGVATVTVVTESFKDVSVSVAAAIGMPNLPICVIPHPLGELTRNNAVKRGSMAFDSLMDRLTKPRAPEASLLTEPAPKAMAVAGTFEEINDQFEALGWSDGLPIVPPTYEAVERFIAAAKRDRDEVIGVIPPMMGLATVEKIAINAVMAGCRPQHLPVVIAAVRAVCDPDFNLLPIQLTTNSVTPMILVSGPMATDLGINGGFNVFGPGNRNNATIGRALRLILTNVGGGTPGKLDKSCHGQPGKFTMCIAENLAESPWTSYHVDQGPFGDGQCGNRHWGNGHSRHDPLHANQHQRDHEHHRPCHPSRRVQEPVFRGRTGVDIRSRAGRSPGQRRGYQGSGAAHGVRTHQSPRFTVQS